MEQESIIKTEVRALTSLPYSGGYRRRSPLLTEFFNIVGALTLIVLTSPFFVMVTVLLWLREGRPIFYRGIRMGKNKKSYYMYKFRTLVTDAEERLKGELVGSRRELVTPTGKFLRDTRLDELPQLFNVLFRSMDLVGPRPERPEVYESKCKNIPNYDRRFLVRPGLVGFSQIFTPHSAPKEIRTLIDNRLIKHQESVVWNLRVLSITGFLVLRAIITKGWAVIRRRLIQQLLLRRYREKRRFDRFRTAGASCSILTPGTTEACVQIDEIVDINVEAFLLRHRDDLQALLPGSFRMEVKVKKMRQGIWKKKTAIVEGEIYRQTQLADGSYEYVVKYTPKSPFNKYLVHQYFLHESVG